MKTLISITAVMAAILTPPPVLPGELSLAAHFTKRAGENSYVVVFPPTLGGQTVRMDIESGRAVLGLDAEAGTARILEWSQDVSPIEIHGMSTGPITVGLDASRPSSGAYDALTGSISVSATFILEFDDTVLASVGFSSPFILTSTENGYLRGIGDLATLYFFTASSGSIGEGEFAYTCRSTAEVEYDIPAGSGQQGDVNADHRLDISDPVSALTHLFLGTPASCPGAIEVSGDGERDISDALFLLSYLFQGGPQPPLGIVECSPQGS